MLPYNNMPSIFQLQNLGFFPVDEVTIKITVPVATRGGNRLLLLTDFIVDQVAVCFLSPSCRIMQSLEIICPLSRLSSELDPLLLRA